MNTELVTTLKDAVPTLRDASQSGNLAVLRSLLGPAFRGLVLHKAKG
jgi:hypothetical protein